jgi:hypothetical protein
MESNREVFLKMSEEHYMSIPDEVRESYLSSKRIDKEKGDWAENMKDAYYKDLNRTLGLNKKKIEEREYQLREERRAIK